MNYSLLTAVHPRRTAPVKMNARQEQEYYDHAAQSLDLAEEANVFFGRARQLRDALAALIQAMRGNFGHGVTARKALH